MKNLETERLILRKWLVSDAEMAYSNWATDEEMHKFVSWPIHKSINETENLINNWIEEYNNVSYNWVVEIKNIHEIIGNIAVGKVNKKQNTCDLGYCYGSKFWGNGYGTEALRAVAEYLLNDENFHLVEAAHVSNNPASGRIMQKAGMHKDGELRERRLSKIDNKYYSLVWYTILKEEL